MKRIIATLLLALLLGSCVNEPIDVDRSSETSVAFYNFNGGKSNENAYIGPLFIRVTHDNDVIFYSPVSSEGTSNRLFIAQLVAGELTDVPQQIHDAVVVYQANTGLLVFNGDQRKMYSFSGKNLQKSATLAANASYFQQKRFEFAFTPFHSAGQISSNRPVSLEVVNSFSSSMIVGSKSAKFGGCSCTPGEVQCTCTTEGQGQCQATCDPGSGTFACCLLGPIQISPKVVAPALCFCARSIPS